MSLTRRTLTVASLAMAASPAFAKPRKPRPIVIGHRGASGERPEHTPMAYRLAIAQGADFIEPDLCITRDGHLVARHENEIGGTTDVAARAEFAGRKTTKVIDGQSITGWFTEDFTLAELKTLRARERLPQLRPANTAYDGQEAVPTFEEVVAIAREGGVGIYPEMKHPTHFAAAGHDFPRIMAAALKANGLDSADARVFVQCFEVRPLKALRPMTKAPLVQLIDSEGGPADTPEIHYADMATAEGLKGVAAYAQGVGPDKSYIVPTDSKVLLPATGFVLNAHVAGLKVHPWTVRAENHFLPSSLRRGDLTKAESPRELGDVAAMFWALYEAGVDGVFSDFPGLAVEARREFLA